MLLVSCCKLETDYKFVLDEEQGDIDLKYYSTTFLEQIMVVHERLIPVTSSLQKQNIILISRYFHWCNSINNLYLKQIIMIVHFTA